MSIVNRCLARLARVGLLPVALMVTLTLSAQPGGAAEASPTCAVERTDGHVVVSWDVGEFKRVNIRNEGGWLGTTVAPATSSELEIHPRQGGYFIIVKPADGERFSVNCREIVPAPLLGITLIKTNGPSCSYSTLSGRVGARNWFGTANLRGSDGWVASLAPDEAPAVPFDEYSVVFSKSIRRHTSRCLLDRRASKLHGEALGRPCRPDSRSFRETYRRTNRRCTPGSA